MRAAFPALLAAAAVLLPARGGAQVLSLYRQHEGTFDYVVTGNTHRTASNTVDACAVGASSTATLALPPGATVEAAYLYWGGSGSIDNTVTFSRPSGGSVSLTADGTATSTFFFNGNNLNYFGAYDDVTALMRGSGTYGVSGLTVNTGNPHCPVQGVTKGWALVVVYGQAGLPIKRIQLRHGLRAFRQATENVTLDSFLATNNPDARVTFLLYEGDDNLAGGAFPEQLLFNGFPFTDALNPANNPFNSTVNSPAPGRSNVYGVDLDTYNASAYLAPRDRSADVALSAGDDMAVLQFILTSLTVALVDVTPDGLAAAEQRLPGDYGRDFLVENTSLSSQSYDLLARITGAPAYAVIDSVTGPGVTRGARADSARIAIPAGATRTVTAWYTVPVGAGGNENLIHLLARSVTFPGVAAAQDTGWTQVVRVSPRLTLGRSVSPAGTSAPGTELTYRMEFSNVGDFAAEGVVIADSVPPQVHFKPGSAAETLPAGVTAVVEYSSDGGATWTYAPVSGGCGAPAGFDACVRRIRWRLLGSLPASAPASTGTLQFEARIR